MHIAHTHPKRTIKIKIERIANTATEIRDNAFALQRLKIIIAFVTFTAAVCSSGFFSFSVMASNCLWKIKKCFNMVP